MGDKHFNPRALAERARPPIGPQYVFGSALQGSFVPKRNVLVVPHECQREGVDGRLELRAPGSGDWEPAPAGAVVVAPGEVGPEHLDYVLEVHSVRQNTRLTDASGNPVVTGFPVREIARMDAREFLQRHDEAAGHKKENDA